MAADCFKGGAVPFVSKLIGSPVLNVKNKRLGRVDDVLFALDEPRAVGYAISPRRLLYLFERKVRYVPWDALVFDDDGDATLPAGSIPSLKASERALGTSWEETVQWRGMPVRTVDDVFLGVVSDVRIASTSGRVREMRVSTGIVGDLAVGRLEVGADFIEGFDGAVVRVLPGYDDLDATGGLAAASAKGVAAVKVHGGRAADKAYDTGVSAAIAVGRSFKDGKGRKMVDKFKKLMDDSDEK